MTLAIGFGAKRADAERAPASRSAPASRPRRPAYAAGWKGYVDSLADAPAPVASDPGIKALYDQSLMVLAASEDKRFRGASIASPSMPWEWGVTALDDKPESGPYHLVWPRDFYHVATAQKAAGDDAGATRLLDYLWKVQKPDGSWWQNTRVNGQEYWTSLQLDETALPIVLAWWLGRTSAADWAHVEKAADFIMAKGPQTEQERWENQSGWCAEHDRHGDRGPDHRGRHRARNGAAGKAAALRGQGRRVAVEGRVVDRDDHGPVLARAVLPARDEARGRGPGPGSRTRAPPTASATTGPEPVDQREIVDNSFLGLTLFGVKQWDDPVILNSLAVGESLGVDTPSGRIYHRFTFDGYGETDSRRRLDDLPDDGADRADARPPVAAPQRRARRVRAARRPAPPRRTSGRSPTPPTTA